MPLQTSGAISLLNIQNEFGGSNPISISEYYRGRRVPNIPENNRVPTSGTISFSNFYGATRGVRLRVTVWGSGGGGGCGTDDNRNSRPQQGAGGGIPSGYNITFRGNRNATGGNAGRNRGSNNFRGTDGADSNFSNNTGGKGNGNANRPNENNDVDGTFGGGGGGGYGDPDNSKRDRQGDGGSGGGAGNANSFDGTVGIGSRINWNLGRRGIPGRNRRDIPFNNRQDGGDGGGGTISFNYSSRNYVFTNNRTYYSRSSQNWRDEGGGHTLF